MQVQPMITPMGWRHLLRCFWYQVEEMHAVINIPNGDTSLCHEQRTGIIELFRVVRQ